MGGKHRGTAQTVRFLKWIRKYGGWWHLICTPNHEKMNPQMMKMLIKKLYQEGFYEIIFVLLMVHRENPILAHTAESLFLDSVIKHWDTDQDVMIQKLLTYFD